jgi:DNA-binding NarL/FixJ family response regulator
LIRRLQQVEGISVVGEAGDPCDALTVVSDRQPDVVVMDLRRIAPNGAEFLGRLVVAAPQAGIVVLTAYLTERERSDLLQAGARAILLKEIDSGALVRTIRMIAARPVADGRRSEA